MKVINNYLSLFDFDAWGGAIETKETIIENGKASDFEYLVDELFPDGLTETQLNDLLWFDEDFIFEQLNIDNDEA